MELNLLKCLYKLNLFSQGLLRYVKKDNIMLNNAQDWTKHCLQVLDICAKKACMVWCCALLHTYDSHSHEWQCKIAAFDTILLCMPLLVFFLLLYYSFILFHIFILCPEITTIKLNRIKYPCHFFFERNLSFLISVYRCLSLFPGVPRLHCLNWQVCACHWQRCTRFHVLISTQSAEREAGPCQDP